MGSPLKSVLLALALATLYLAALDRPELLDPDESRHAEIAREMLATASFVTPQLRAEPYYDKPVGFYWTVALSLAALGPGTAAARLPAALAALATLAVTGWWARRLGGRDAARLAALGLGTTLLFLAVGRLATVDMLFTALLTSAIALLSVAMTEPAQTRRSLIPFYALVALACLVKGPAAIVLAMPCVIAVGIALRRRGEHASLRPLAGTLIAFAITGPWYLAAYLADPAYLRAFIGLHNFARFLGTDELGHQSSIAYYALTLPVALLPWTPLVALGCVRHWRRPTAAHASGDGGVLWTWLASIALVFGAASTRLVTYLLPAFPALFVAAATGLAADSAAHHAAAPRWLGRWTKVWAFFVAATIAASAATALVSLPSVPGVEPRATVALALALVLPLVVSRCVASRWPSAIAIALAAGSFVTAVGAYGPVADLLTGAKGFRVLAAELKPVLPPDSVLSSLSRAPHALAFYLERPIGEVRDLDGARELLDSAAPVFLLTKIRYVDALLNERERGVEVIWRNEQGTTLLVNRAAASAWRRREGVEPSADLYGRQHGFEDRSGHRTRSLSASEKPVAYP